MINMPPYQKIQPFSNRTFFLRMDIIHISHIPDGDAPYLIHPLRSQFLLFTERGIILSSLPNNFPRYLS